MTPYKHAQSSAATWGGTPEAYIAIHDWLDETKQYTGDFTHRALRHHAAGVQWCIDKFGHSITVGDRQVPVKPVAEQHIIEDVGYIPTVSDWLDVLREHPADWMLRVKKTKTQALVVGAADG